MLRPAVHILLITGLGLILYSNTFYSPFQWDEAYFLVGNPAVEDITYFSDPEPVRGMSLYGIKNRVAGYISFALNYRIHGFDVLGFHIVNLAIHIINAVLVYLIVLFTFRTPFFQGLVPGSEKGGGGRSSDWRPLACYPALFASLMFVSHPVQTEAVTYIFQRFTSLVSMFYMLSLVTYIKARLSSGSSRRAAVFWSLLSLLSAVFAMKTKENAFTLPVIVSLYDFLFFTGSFRSRVLRLAPWLLTFFIIPAAVLEIEGSFGEVVEPMTEPTALGYENLSRSEYLFTQFRVIVTYIRLLLFPVNQNLVYDYPVYRSFYDFRVILSFLLLVVLFGAALLLIFRPQRSVRLDQKMVKEPECAVRCAFFRLTGFGILWFFITLSIESSIIPLAMVIDEYRIYLPSVGFFLAIVGTVLLLVQKFPKYLKITAGFFAAILIIFSLAAYNRNSVWKDKISLWEDVASKNSKSPKVYNNLGIAYYEAGRYKDAIQAYMKAISLSPDNFFAIINLGVAHATTGRADLAIGNFMKAISIEPGNSVAYANLARAFRQSGDFQSAAEAYEKALDLNFRDRMPFFELASTYMTLGKPDLALEVYERYIGLNPGDPEAYRSRGKVYSKLGDYGRAAEDFNQACAMGDRESCLYLR